WPAPAMPLLILLIPVPLWSFVQWLTWGLVLVLALLQLLLAWHLRFDGLLFRSLAESGDDGSGLDTFLFQQWGKPMSNKTLAQRISGSQALIKRYLIVTVAFWCSVLLWRLWA
ncbi:MAG: hypothetical protein ACRC6G_10635, partial [Deefgea sp.]